jgi:cell division septum initiation protein DivIVA
MVGFSVVKRGYDAVEVEEYIAKNNLYLENKLKEQKLRINELKGQNLKLASKIKELNRREDDVKNALIAANEKSKELMSAAKLKYALEGQRLRLLQAKWTSYFETNAQKDDGDYKRGEAYYIRVETEIQEILRNDFGIVTEKSAPSVNDEIMSQYRSETKRLFDGDTEKEVYGELIKRIKKEFGGEFSAGLIDELEEIIEPDDDFDPDYIPVNSEKKFDGERDKRYSADGKRPNAEKNLFNPNYVSADADTGLDADDRRDFTNLAAIKPDRSLEELCKDLGL